MTELRQAIHDDLRTNYTQAGLADALSYVIDKILAVEAGEHDAHDLVNYVSGYLTADLQDARRHARRLGYVCPQCGPDPAGEEAHAERRHTAAGLGLLD